MPENPEFALTIGEARGIAKVIEKYPHVTMRDQWNELGGNEAVRLERRPNVPLILKIRTEAPKADLPGYAPDDVWQILRNGYPELLVRGTEVVG